MFGEMAVKWRLRALLGDSVSLMLRPDDEGSISGGMSCMGRSGTLTSPQVQSQSPERKQDRVTHVRWHTSSRSVIWYRAI